MGSPCPVVGRIFSLPGPGGLGPGRSAPRTAPPGQGRGVVSMETSPRAGVSRARSRAAGAAASRDPGSCPGCAPPALTLHLQAPDQPLCRAEPAGRVSAAAPPFWVLLPLLPPSWGGPSAPRSRVLGSCCPQSYGAPRGNQGGGRSVTLASPLADRGSLGLPALCAGPTLRVQCFACRSDALMVGFQASAGVLQLEDYRLSCGRCRACYLVPPRAGTAEPH